MKKIAQYLRNHLRDDFQAGYYVAIAVLLGMCLSINYILNFQHVVIDHYRGQHIRILYYFFFYAFAYYSAVLIMVYFKKDYGLLRKRAFWIKSLFILAILALDAAFHYHELIINRSVNYQLHYWSKKVIKNLTNIVTILIPLWIFYKAYDKKMDHFYGLRAQHFDFRPYFSILLAMMPVIFIASFFDNFNDFYPNYKVNPAAHYLHTPEWVPAIVYELAYGWNFLTIELVFRGFMILGLASVMGRNVVIPMVVTYCFLHFGKPAGEAISSIFGGYILGVIALETRSIFGGVVVHVGIAWMMELFAWLQQVY